LKESYIFIICPRDVENVLDYCKVADVICPILSCKNCDVDKVALDPYYSSNSFDDLAYKTLSCLRVQGLPSILCLL